MFGGGLKSEGPARSRVSLLSRLYQGGRGSVSYGGDVEAVDDDVDVVGDGGCEAVYAGDGAEAEGEGDERVLDDVLASIFLPKTNEEAS
jgi:hypothetical protein